MKSVKAEHYLFLVIISHCINVFFPLDFNAYLIFTCARNADYTKCRVVKLKCEYKIQRNNGQHSNIKGGGGNPTKLTPKL